MQSNIIEKENEMFETEIVIDKKNTSINLNELTWLDSKDAANYLRKTTNALRIMVFRGYLRPRKFKRRLYFRRIELDRLIDSSCY